MNLEFVTHDSRDVAHGSVIWLHGLGADGHDFADIVPQLNLPESLDLRFIFPHAPIRPVTLNNNMQMRAWFDIYSLERNEKIDHEGITQALEYINEIIEHEIDKGIPADKIVLAGFSQGGAIALHAGLKSPKKLAGILALSTFMPLVHELNGHNKSIPIFMAHGKADLVLPLALGRDTYEVLKELGYSIEWHEYPMAHQVCAQELKDIKAWLINRF